MCFYTGPDSIETDEGVISQIETSETAKVVWNQRDHESFIGKWLKFKRFFKHSLLQSLMMCFY
jgi:hypothetical protein